MSSLVLVKRVVPLIAFCVALVSCRPEKEQVFENEYGQVSLKQLNDSVVHARFSNNEGKEFEADLSIQHTSTLIALTDSLPFLAYKTGGIEQLNGSICLHDFANMALFSEATGIEQIYTRPFFETGKSTLLRGDLKAEKGGASVDGIYLDNYELTETGYRLVSGTIRKEPWPGNLIPDDPNQQSIWNDRSKKHYRLVMENYTVTKPENRHLSGYTINVNGEAALVCDEAHTTLYYLYGAKPWTEKELNKRIEVEASLVQFNEGKSVLKNWKEVR